MQDIIKRLFEEQEELNVKINKLKDFLDGEKIKELDAKQQELLNRQYSVMWEYKCILNERTALILKEEEEK